MELFSVQDLTFSYPGQTVPTLERLSFDISAGEFLVIAGPSGCGKSTLLRQFKTALTPHGSIQGQLLFQGVPLKQVDPRTQASKIGFVQQNPDNQIVTDKVWHELAFGLESLGYKSAEIRIRVAEMASYFGIQDWFYKNVAELSGGQKQLLNLASIMAMHPDILILDEPTSQLDPIAASRSRYNDPVDRAPPGRSISGSRPCCRDGGRRSTVHGNTGRDRGRIKKTEPRNVSGNAGSDADLCKSKFRKA